MEYSLFPTAYTSGFVKTGLTGIINDRDQTLTVPWEVTETGSKNIIFTRASDDGKTYRVTVPVTITVSNGSSTAAYTHGTITIAEVVQNG